MARQFAEAAILRRYGELRVPYLEAVARADDERDAADPAELAHRWGDPKRSGSAACPLDQTEGAARAAIMRLVAAARAFVCHSQPLGAYAHRFEMRAAVADKTRISFMRGKQQIVCLGLKTQRLGQIVG